MIVGKLPRRLVLANQDGQEQVSYQLTPRRGEVLLLGTRTLRYIQAGGGDGGDVAANARILVKKLASRQILLPPGLVLARPEQEQVYGVVRQQSSHRRG